MVAESLTTGGKSFTYVLTLSSLLQTVNAQNKGFFQMFTHSSIVALF